MDLDQLIARDEKAIAKKKWAQEYYLANKAKILARNAAWWKAHPEQRRLKDRRRHHRNSAKRCEAARLRRKKDPEKYRARNREWQRKRWAHRQEYYRKYYAKKSELIRSKSSAWYQANKKWASERNGKYVKSNRPLINARLAKYRDKNREKLNEYHQKWRDKNRAAWTAKSQHRRALQKKATVNLSQIKEWMSTVMSKPFAFCYWCQSKIPVKSIHFDHIVAISRGGEHRVENLCVSCAPCNLSKNDKPVRLWTKVNQQFLEL